MPLTVIGGFLGVDMFFALSGYLITRLLLSEYWENNRIDLLSFYKRRLTRLGPALALMLTVYGIFVWLFAPSAAMNDQGLDIALTLFYLTNWVRALHLKEIHELGHTWSLALEEQFYIIWPLILWALCKFTPDRRKLLLSIVSLATISLLLRQCYLIDNVNIDRIYNGLDTRAENLMWGATLAVAMSYTVGSSFPNEHRACAQASIVITFCAIVTMITLTTWNSISYYRYGISGIALLTCALIFQLSGPGTTIIRKFLELRPLVWLGSISYGVYLWHYPIYKLLIFYGLNNWMVLAVGFTITLPVAAISYYGMEQPLLRRRPKSL